jgi:hypothetical protein
MQCCNIEITVVWYVTPYFLADEYHRFYPYAEMNEIAYQKTVKLVSVRTFGAARGIAVIRKHGTFRDSGSI